MPLTKQGRYDTIDLLRGLVIVFVVLFHTNLRFAQEGYDVAAGMPRALSDLLFANGYHSMAAIFTISGFIIAWTSMERFGSLGAIELKRFYRFRFARILPPLLLVVLVLSALHFARVPGFTIKQSQGESYAGTLFSVLTFHLNWYESVHGYLPICWDVLWTLSVEELFYAVFPLACVALLRSRAGRAAFVGLLLGLVAAGPPSRTVWAFNEIWAKKGYLSAMDGIALGVLSALIAARMKGAGGWSRGGLRALEGLGVALLVLVCAGWRAGWLKAFRRTLAHAGLDETLVAAAVCLILIASVLLNRRGSRVLAPLRWYGRRSYEHYLTHEFVVIAASVVYLRVERGAFGWWLAGTLLLTAPVGWAFARGYSEPLNRRLRGLRAGGSRGA